MTLDQLPLGREAVITRIGGVGPLRLRLLDMGLIPRTALTVHKTAPMGDPIEITLRGYSLTLRLEDANARPPWPRRAGKSRAVWPPGGRGRTGAGICAGRQPKQRQNYAV